MVYAWLPIVPTHGSSALRTYVSRGWWLRWMAASGAVRASSAARRSASGTWNRPAIQRTCYAASVRAVAVTMRASKEVTRVTRQAQR